MPAEAEWLYVSGEVSDGEVLGALEGMNPRAASACERSAGASSDTLGCGFGLFRPEELLEEGELHQPQTAERRHLGTDEKERGFAEKAS